MLSSWNGDCLGKCFGGNCSAAPPLNDAGLGSSSFSLHKPSLGVNHIIALTGLFPSRNRRRSNSDPLLGSMTIGGYNFAPRGWLPCDGRLLPISSNTALFSLLGTTYGGDGRTTFRIPDLRGRHAVGSGTGLGLSDARLGSKYGESFKILNSAHMPAHVHGSIVPHPSVSWNRRKLLSVTPGEVYPTVLNAGGSRAINVEQPNLAIGVYIAEFGVFPSRNRRSENNNTSAQLHEKNTDKFLNSRNNDINVSIDSGSGVGNGIEGEPAIQRSRRSAEPFIGQVMPVGYNFAPRGWALCQGQLLSINQFEALFSLLGTTYGGDGRTTFGLPDLRGRVPVHPGHGPGLSSIRLGQKLGNPHVTLNSLHLPVHNHNVTFQENSTASRFCDAGTHSFHVQGSGGSQAFNTEQPALVINWAIALFGTYPSRNRRGDTSVGKTNSSIDSTLSTRLEITNSTMELSGVSSNRKVRSIITAWNTQRTCQYFDCASFGMIAKVSSSDPTTFAVCMNLCCTKNECCEPMPTEPPTTSSPSSSPTVSLPTGTPTTLVPTTDPTTSPSSSAPTNHPSVSPSTSMPTPAPSASPATASPTPQPSQSPATSPPTPTPTASPATASPTPQPSQSPATSPPTPTPTASPVTASPTPQPSQSPATSPTPLPSQISEQPTASPTVIPTGVPTVCGHACTATNEVFVGMRNGAVHFNSTSSGVVLVNGYNIISLFRAIYSEIGVNGDDGDDVFYATSPTLSPNYANSTFFGTRNGDLILDHSGTIFMNGIDIYRALVGIEEQLAIAGISVVSRSESPRTAQQAFVGRVGTDLVVLSSHTGSVKMNGVDYVRRLRDILSALS